jgi:hypothetical protein
MIEEKTFDDRFDGMTSENKRSFHDAIQAHALKLMNSTYDPPKPAPDGFAHWPTQPHGAADVFAPHLTQSEAGDPVAVEPEVIDVEVIEPTPEELEASRLREENAKLKTEATQKELDQLRAENAALRSAAAGVVTASGTSATAEAP